MVRLSLTPIPTRSGMGFEYVCICILLKFVPVTKTVPQSLGQSINETFHIRRGGVNGHGL